MSVHRKILEKSGRLESLQQQQQQQIPNVQCQEIDQQKWLEKQDEEVVKNIEEYQQYNSINNIRSTCRVFPRTKEMYMEAKIPFAVIIQPYGQSIKQGFPCVNYGSNPIMRCQNCRAYINPFMERMKDEEYLRCNICTCMIKIPKNFLQPEDLDKRADLCTGSYDIKAGQEYQMRPPMAPAYFFMIDVSSKSEGILGIMGQIIKDMIVEDKFNERTLFGFITYDTNIHLYNFNSKLKQVQMYVLTDDNDMPTPGDYLFNLQESKDIIVAFLNQLSVLFPKPKEKSTQFIAALNLTQKIMQDNGGKLIILTSYPIKELNITENQKSPLNHFQPTNNILKQICEKMHLNYICPSIFIVPAGFNNVGTLNQLVKYLNGDMFYYDDLTICTQRFYYDFLGVLGKDYTWESVFRIRLSIGWKIKCIYGNYTVKNADLLNVTCTEDQKVLMYELELNQPRAPYDNLYIQTALLYTSNNGERRIRVHNICIPITNSIKTIYSQIDQPCLAISLYKIALSQLNIAKDVKDCIQTKDFLIAATRSISNNCKLFKEPLDSLHSYMLGIMKSQILHYNFDQLSVLTDYINYQRSIYQYLNVDELVTYIVPQLYNISDLKEQECIYDDSGYFIYPQSISLVLEEVSNGGLLLMDCGNYLILFICKIHDENQMADIFGKHYQNMNLVEDNLYSNSQNPINDKLYYLLNELRNNKYTKYAPLYIVKQGSKTRWEELFFQNLIYDDFNKNYRMGYNQFVQYIG
ncbi:unnamed protein product [Paramecium sonneborni]|uniref:Uncharacterized protein n=1 Tax=Paramecium sonneborni TaxID=65129 RepID=A0A8S1NVK3_9CILI|nr:unnamed protein product [Paramecium sonneborni]